MRYIKEKTVYQYEIQKSIFIGIAYPIYDATDIKKAIDDAKMMFPKANHYCSASLLGAHQEQQSADDDGEPSRTAGIPILEVLKHHDVTDILVVVIRYFGGIKLGAGGLVRAYTKAAAEVMKLVKYYKKVIVDTYQITFDYASIDTIDRFLNEKATLLERTFLERVTYRFYFNNEHSTLDDIDYLLSHRQLLEPKLLYIDE